MRKGIVACAACMSVLLGAGAAAGQTAERCYDSSGQFSDAQLVVNCTRWIRSKTITTADRAFGYITRGWAYEAQHDNDNAIADYNRAIELTPRDPIAYFKRGTANFGKHDYDQAIADYDQALSFGPNREYEILAYHNRGIAYAAKQDYGHAIADFDHTIQLSATYSAAYYSRAEVYEAEGDFDRALADVDAALDHWHDDPVGRELRAKIVAEKAGQAGR